MADWYCFKDKEKMVKAEATLTYMGITQGVPCIKCPICDVQYLTENVVMTTVKDAESILEGK